MWAWFKWFIGDGILERKYLLKQTQFQWRCAICGDVIVEKMVWRDLIQVLSLIKSIGINNPVSKNCRNGHHNSIKYRGDSIEFTGSVTPEELKKRLSDGFQWKCAICGEEMRKDRSKEILSRTTKSISEECKKGHHNRLFMFPEEDYEVYGQVELESLFWD